MKPVFKTTLGLLAAAILVVCCLAIIPVELLPTQVDHTAINRDSEFVVVHGLPWYFYIQPGTDLAHTPSSLHLFLNFLGDVGVYFSLFSAVWIGAELLALLGRFLSRAASSAFTFYLRR